MMRPSAVMLALALVGAACSGSGEEAPSTISDGGVLIPPTTKVLDDATRSALVGVAEDGTLTFDAVTPALSALSPGDVVVSGVSTAAPDGLLRKVRSVTIDDNGVVVATDGALLTDAVHRGSAAFAGELGAADIVETSVAMAGVQVTASGGAVTGGGAPGGFAAPRTARGRRAVQEIAYTFNTDLGSGGALRVSGTAGITPVLEADVSISCDETIELFGFPICAEIPDLNFMAQLGIRARAQLSVVGTASVSFARRYEIATHRFTPITLVIGVVPVVLTPSMTVYLQGDGSLSATMNYVVMQRLDLIAGFRYNSDTGFQDISRRTSTFERPDPVFAGSVRAKGMVGAQFDLRLYGVVGPFAALEGGVEFRADLTGLSAGGVLWQVDGCIRLLAGIDSVEVLNLHYSSEIYKGCVGFAQGDPNHNPSTDIVTPTPGTLIYQNDTVALRANAIDVDGGELRCRWTSSVPGDPFPVIGCEGVSASFASVGNRRLTLTVTDPAGASATDSVDIVVTRLPAISVEISSPGSDAILHPDGLIALVGSAAGGVGPYALLWKIRFPTDASGLGGDTYAIGTGSNLEWTPSSTITFPSCAVGEYAVLILDATDARGATGRRERLVGFLRIC